MVVRRVVSAALGILAAAGAIVALPSVPADAQQETILALSYNICGNKCHDGRLGVADHVAETILNRTPRTAALQEVCAGQAQRLRTRLADAGYRVWHEPTARTCDDGSAYGIAIAFRGDEESRLVRTLPNPNGHEPRKVQCVRLVYRDLAACNTHIDFHGDGTRGVQIREVSQVMAELAQAGRRSYIGGDFNTAPTEDALDVMYLPAYGGGAGGVHNEASGCCARAGQATGDGGRKIDYLFARGGSFAPDSVDVVPSDESDHHRLWGRFVVR